MQQQSSDKNTNFFDPKTLLAIVLVGIVWIGWQNYLSNKYPDAYKPKTAEQNAEKTATGDQNSSQNQGTESSATLSAEGKTSVNNNSAGTVTDKPTPSNNSTPEQITSFENEVWNMKISSKGMGFKQIQLNTYTDSKGRPISLTPKAGYLPFETNLVGFQSPLNFTIKQVGENQFVGVANKNGLRIEKTITLNPENYSFDVNVVVKNIKEQFSGVVNFVSKDIAKVETSFFMPAMNQQEFFVAHGSTTDREYLTADTGAEPGAFARAHVVSLGEQYFALAMVDRSDIIPEAKFAFDTTKNIAVSRLTHSVINRADQFQIKYVGYAGPKDLDILKRVDATLADIIDFGWFSWLAHILFDILRWFFSIFGNWGIAIIALTILVRIFVLPFHMMSYRSMKAMQDIQPQIKALREKYKDDQQRLNQEMMSFMKDNKVNPMGGCLPMLLQFPVFIALYRVFGQSIDLYQAPFGLWIHDLSMKDPYYILPVVMGVVFFLQTKLTPTTMDPNQQKVMMIMPVMFAFFMAGLPSALTLYMCVSTIFGFLQQMYVMKDKKAATASTAKA